MSRDWLVIYNIIYNLCSINVLFEGKSLLDIIQEEEWIFSEDEEISDEDEDVKQDNEWEAELTAVKVLPNK